MSNGFGTNNGNRENIGMNKTIGCAMIVTVAACLALTAVGQSTAPATKPSTSPATGPASQPAKELTLDLGNKVTMKLVEIPAGKFMMGSPDSEKDREECEGPQHKVTITKPFYMGVHAVTQAQWEAVMGTTLAQQRDKADNAWQLYGDGAKYPMYYVSWDDAVEFCKALSKKTGKTVNLPTEAQWEYACRAGSKTRFGYGDDDDKLDDYAWYTKNSGRMTHPVGQKKPNDWGLYDMHGNVWQWCSDWYDESYANADRIDPTGPISGPYRVRRGGSWTNDCRSAVRDWGSPDVRGNNVGFRVSVDLK